MKEWRRQTDFLSSSAFDSSMGFFLQKLALFNTFFLFASEVVESGFNAAYLKRTEANFTCGDPPEYFYETQQGLLAPEDRIQYTCNASDPEKAYPPENMVDGLLETHWQSRKGEDLAIITISFEQVPEIVMSLS